MSNIKRISCRETGEVPRTLLTFMCIVTDTNDKQGHRVTDKRVGEKLVDSRFETGQTVRIIHDSMPYNILLLLYIMYNLRHLHNFLIYFKYITMHKQ